DGPPQPTAVSKSVDVRAKSIELRIAVLILIFRSSCFYSGNGQSNGKM
ncbi:MAG: hypothetical protein ACI9HK_000935, partial [Pirellulaceae bacterium]